MSADVSGWPLGTLSLGCEPLGSMNGGGLGQGGLSQTRTQPPASHRFQSHLSPLDGGQPAGAQHSRAISGQPCPWLPAVALLFHLPLVPCYSLGAAPDLAPLPRQRRVTRAEGCPPCPPCGTGRRRPPGGCSCPRLRRAAAAPPGPPPWPPRRPRAGSAGRHPPGSCDERPGQLSLQLPPASPTPGRRTDNPEQGPGQHVAPITRGQLGEVGAGLSSQVWTLTGLGPGVLQVAQGSASSSTPLGKGEMWPKAEVPEAAQEGEKAPRPHLRGSTVGAGLLTGRSLGVHWTQDLPVISAWPTSCTLSGVGAGPLSTSRPLAEASLAPVTPVRLFLLGCSHPGERSQ